MATEKNKSYADLIVPFTCCPFEKVEEDCPFTAYWNNMEFDKMLTVIDQMPEEELVVLRKHHQNCLQLKIDRGEEMVHL